MNTVSTGTSVARAGSTNTVGARLFLHAATTKRAAKIRRRWLQEHALSPVYDVYTELRMRIDAHQHFWDLSRFCYPWMPADATSPLRHDFLPRSLAENPCTQQIRWQCSRSGDDRAVKKRSGCSAWPTSTPSFWELSAGSI